MYSLRTRHRSDFDEHTPSVLSAMCTWLFWVSSSSQQVSIYINNWNFICWFVILEIMYCVVLTVWQLCGEHICTQHTCFYMFFMSIVFHGSNRIYRMHMCSRCVLVYFYSYSLWCICLTLNIGVIKSCAGYLRNETNGVCTACPVGSFYQLGNTARNATCGLCAAGSISNSVASLVCTRIFTVLSSWF